MNWFCYLIISEVSNNTYIGITTDIDRRLKQHNGIMQGGAKNTRRERPYKLIGTVSGFKTRSEASKFEYSAKQKKGYGERIKLFN